MVSVHSDRFGFHLVCFGHSINDELLIEIFNLASCTLTFESQIFVLDEVVIDFEELRPQLHIAQYRRLECTLDGFADLEQEVIDVQTVFVQFGFSLVGLK